MSITPQDPIIDVKYNLKLHVDKQSVISKLVEFVLAIPQFEDLKLDVQLTKTLCDLIEHLLPNNKQQIDKLEVLLTALKRIFINIGFAENEINIIKQQVLFLFNNKKIKGIRLSKRCIKSASRWIFRRLG